MCGTQEYTQSTVMTIKLMLTLTVCIHDSREILLTLHINKLEIFFSFAKQTWLAVRKRILKIGAFFYS